LTECLAALFVADVRSGRCMFGARSILVGPEQAPAALGAKLLSPDFTAARTKLSNIHERRGHMLSDNNAIATVGVKNLEKSKEFYERMLGLTKVMENDDVLAFKTGSSIH
jgi:hypothetical protein